MAEIDQREQVLLLRDHFAGQDQIGLMRLSRGTQYSPDLAKQRPAVPQVEKDIQTEGGVEGFGRKQEWLVQIPQIVTRPGSPTYANS